MTFPNVIPNTVQSKNSTPSYNHIQSFHTIKGNLQLKKKVNPIFQTLKFMKEKKSRADVIKTKVHVVKL
jgi:hypothetical protein